MKMLASLLALTLLVGCGDPTAVDHIDAMLEDGKSYRHSILPRPAPDAKSSMLKTLRKNEHARAVLDAGEDAVPKLIDMLADEERRTLAAVFLAEIGGDDAAAALLKQWRMLRQTRIRKTNYSTAGYDSRLTMGTEYDGVDPDFYGELLHALSYCGRSQSAAIAADTLAALEDSEQRLAAGEQIGYETPDEPHDGWFQCWWIGSVETTNEGLQMLAMVRASEAPDVFARALSSELRPIRFAAIQEAGFIGPDAQALIPALWDKLDSPKFREDALEAIIQILDEPGIGTLPVPRSPTEAEWAGLVLPVKARLQELGHIPR